MARAKTWTAALLVIGDEILSGRTQDKNVAQLATWLNVQGIRLAEVRVVPDSEERIVAAVRALAVKSRRLRAQSRATPRGRSSSQPSRRPGKCPRASVIAGIAACHRAHIRTRPGRAR
mgnify:CR=1 FL=1